MKAEDFYYTLGRPFAPLYSAVMRLRETCYRRGLFATHRLGVPVISVGNLTVGGTGKTPMVQHLARLLKDNGFRPAVVSRGYGGKAQARVNLVSDGSRLLLDADQAGDEPRFLAETLPGVPVLTGIVRRLPAQQAIAMGADVLLLDDGFQHMQVARDVNLALFNADRLAGNSRVFPGGELRESVGALRRATAFVLTGVDDANRERATRFADLLTSRFPGIPITLASYHSDAVVRLSVGGLLEPAEDDCLARLRLFGFCGIARPESFHRTVQAAGFDLCGFQPLADHQRYGRAVLDRIKARAGKAGAEALVTTEKDLVKLAGCAADLAMPLFALRRRVIIDPAFASGLLATARDRAGWSGKVK
ncbi:MAG: tetraacyldisaccharide 4'-kinase [Desulfobulbus sp.]|nr:tetraacyldisaccharide 4'-kinase [Desulfobulbus sp.]